MVERRYRVKRLQEGADGIRELLSLLFQIRHIKPSMRIGFIKDNAPALSLTMVNAGGTIASWLLELDDLIADLGYRDRALRAERWLRQARKCGKEPRKAGTQ